MKKIYFSLIILIFVGMMAIPSSAEYTYTGTIHENGDPYWDDNESVFIMYEIDADETFELEISTNTGILSVIVCECEDKGDVSDIVLELFSGSQPDELYTILVTEPGYESASITFDERVDVNVVIMSDTRDNPSSMQYTLTTNFEQGNRVLDINWALVFVAVIGISFIGFSYYNKQQNGTSNETPNLYQQYQSTQQNTQSYETSSSNRSKFCHNCGSPVESVFCTECGTKVN